MVVLAAFGAGIFLYMGGLHHKQTHKTVELARRRSAFERDPQAAARARSAVMQTEDRQGGESMQAVSAGGIPDG